jgi:hypothetical protein
MLFEYWIKLIGHRSVVIRHIETEIQKQGYVDRAVCLYVFFDHQDRERQSLPNILADLLKQVVTKRDHLSRTIKEAYYERYQGERLNQEEYIQLLKHELAAIPEVYIIIDALDECPNGHGSKSIGDQLVLNFSQLQKHIKLLFTSRKSEFIEKTINAGIKLQITADQGELKEYFASRPQTILLA